MTMPAPRSAAAVLRDILALLPDGFASTHSPNDFLGARFAPLANEISLIEASALSMVPQIDPRTAPDLLPDWQRVLGPDTCQVLAGITDTTLLANIAYQQLTDAGGPYAGRFIALAALLGIDLSITEFPLTECGGSVCGDELIADQGNLFFDVSQPIFWAGDGICGDSVCGGEMGGFQFPSGDVTCGGSVCGDSLDGFWPAGIGCVIRRETPLFLEPIFTYTPTVP